MRAAAFETILPSGPITSLPLRLVQTPSRSMPLLMLALAIPAALAVLAPYYLIAAHAAQNASLLVERLETSILLGFAFVLWALVFCWPVARRARNLGRQRTITIGGDFVHVIESSFFGHRAWSESVSAYRGIAHHVRSSLGGTRHELLLIHPDPARSLLLRAADKIGQAEIDSLTLLLGCREIAPQVFYRNTEQGISLPFLAGKAKLASIEA